LHHFLKNCSYFSAAGLAFSFSMGRLLIGTVENRITAENAIGFLPVHHDRFSHAKQCAVVRLRFSTR
jgi:hypothetical protein